jgi:hypothetical protein
MKRGEEIVYIESPYWRNDYYKNLTHGKRYVIQDLRSDTNGFNVIVDDDKGQRVTLLSASQVATLQQYRKYIIRELLE